MHMQNKHKILKRMFLVSMLSNVSGFCSGLPFFRNVFTVGVYKFIIMYKHANT